MDRLLAPGVSTGRVRGAVTVFACMCVVIGAGCRSSVPPRPNVVLIVVDTLRADHLGAYGYDKPTSPHLDALARAGARFTNARAPSSWTLPSVTSMMTGLYPASHGAEINTATMSEQLATMAEAFRDAGYLTTAFSANPAFVTPLQGFGRGFDEFTVLHGPVSKSARQSGNTGPSDPWLRSMVELSDADVVTNRALGWIAGHDAAPAPYFLYLHYFDPHAGYFPPEKYAVRFGVAADDPLRGDAQWPLLLAFRAPENPNDMATLGKLYDAEIAFTDDQLGLLIDGIRARGGRPTYFLVVSDHGEELGDHGGLQHGRTLFDELIRVPLIVVGPGIAPGLVVDGPVSLVGLWATLSQLTGIHGPAKSEAPGWRDLLEGKKVPNANVYADLGPRFPRDFVVHRRAVVMGQWKLAMKIDRSASLYDLQNDPTEQQDVRSLQPNWEETLRALVRAHESMSSAARAKQPPATIELTPERRDRLKALGYLR
jgi:arylsulfatase A-like enzyme